MMGAELLLFDSAWLCLKAFHLIAEDRSCSLKARDVRATSWTRGAIVKQRGSSKNHILTHSKHGNCSLHWQRKTDPWLSFTRLRVCASDTACARLSTSKSIVGPIVAS